MVQSTTIDTVHANLRTLTHYVISKHLKDIQTLADASVPPEQRAQKKQQLTAAIVKEIYSLQPEVYKQFPKKDKKEQGETEKYIQYPGDENRTPARRTEYRKLAVPLYRRYPDRNIVNRITCNICGHSFKNLANHLHKKHSVTTEEYKAEYPETRYFLSESLRIALSKQNENYISGQKRYLTETEIAFVKNNFHIMKNHEIAEALKLPLPVITKIIAKYIHEKKVYQQKWTEKEMNFLRQNYTQQTYEDIARALHRTTESVTAKAHSLGLVKTQTHQLWTTTEEAFLETRYKELTAKELAFLLNRSEASLRAKIKRMKIERKKVQHSWSTTDLLYLADNYQEKTAEEIAEKIGCTVTAVRKKAQYLGLKKIKAGKS